MNLNKIMEVYDTLYYTENFIPFRKAVDCLYKLRMEFKKDGNDVMYNMVKIQLNSGLFGKFAQKINDKSEMFNIDDIYSEENGSVYVLKNDKKHYLHDYSEKGNYVFNKPNARRRS